MQSKSRKTNRWGSDERCYVEQNYGRVSLEEMARHLSKTPMAVRLFAMRHRLDEKHQVVKENRLKKLLSFRFRHLEDFTPSKFFYKETGINQVRFWDLFYGRKPIKKEEYAAVADYFNITLAEAFGSLQLDLFNNED